MVFYREHIGFSRELREIVIADVAIAIAFSLYLIGGARSLGLPGGISVFLYFLPITLIASTLVFVLHELMHKFTAQHFGAIAAFRSSTYGLAITLISGIVGFFFGIPGATVIYTNSFTKRQEGLVSLAGPLTNLAIFVILLGIGVAAFPGFFGSILSTFSTTVFQNSYAQNTLNLTLFISILLAFFNMLPIYPLDGSKVLKWNKGVYAAALIIIFALFASVMPLYSLIASLLFILVFAVIVSLFFRGFAL